MDKAIQLLMTSLSGGSHEQDPVTLQDKNQLEEVKGMLGELKQLSKTALSTRYDIQLAKLSRVFSL